MGEPDQPTSELQAQLDRLESLREVMGEAAYQATRARLVERLREQALQGRLSGETGQAQADLTVIFQSRQIRVGSDAAGNVLISGDNNLVLNLPPGQAAEPLLKLYYQSLAAECSRLPLGLIHEEFARPGGQAGLSLPSIYTDLDVVSAPTVEKGADKIDELRRMGLRLERGEGGERMPVLQAVSQPESPYLALLGLPGAGKTTFINYLTARLAQGEAGELPEPLRLLLPVRLVLRYATQHLPLEARYGTAEMLWNALGADLARHISQRGAELVLPILQQRLAQQGGLVLLDGLDEVPDAGQRRKCLLEAVGEWVGALTRCRFLLTARPYAYVDPKWQLPGFKIIALAAFNQAQIEHFIRRWYSAVRPSQGWRAEEAQRRAGELQRAIQGKAYLGDMASRPLLLTLMATLHSYKSRMPEDRADLYEFSVDLLLTRWQEGRQEKDEAGQPYIDAGMQKVLGLGEARLRAALEELALQTQRKQGQSSAGRQEAVQGIPADIPFGEVLAVFSKYAPGDLNPDLLVRYLENRAGLLVGRGEGVYTFPHRSFQEYLAACRLGNLGQDDRDVPQRLADLAREDMDWWREVFLLGVGRQRHTYSSAVDILNRLVPSQPEQVQAKDDFHWRAAALAAEAALDLRLPEHTPGNDYYQVILKRLQDWLVALLAGGRLPARERLQAGDLLGRLGDPRPGVGVILQIDKDNRRFELPDIAWVRIPAGEFLMGSLAGDEEAYDDERPQHSVVLPDYWISRYPLTNAQFRHFVEGDGYQNMEYWTPEGWAWRQGAEPDFTPVEKLGDRDFLKRYKDWIAARQDRSRPHWWDEPRWGSANRPVVGVTWYEALAYCAWLEPRLRAAPPGLGIDPHLQEALEHGKLRLPSEAEWEKAGRGRDGRQWPWGNRWRENAGNVNESKLSETSPVGMFPGGASPYGLLDMAGNVWEWTSSRWGMDLGKPEYGYPYQQRDGREALDGAHARVVRGGSWATNHWYARCASRLRYFPAFFDDDVGFRMVLSLARSET